MLGNDRVGDRNNVGGENGTKEIFGEFLAKASIAERTCNIGKIHGIAKSKHEARKNDEPGKSAVEVCKTIDWKEHKNMSGNHKNGEETLKEIK